MFFLYKSIGPDQKIKMANISASNCPIYDLGIVGLAESSDIHVTVIKTHIK